MKITRQPDVTPSGIRPAAYDMAKEAAIEKAKSEYIELICGDLTTWEADQVYSVFRSDKKSHFCEKCSSWKQRITRKIASIPALPLF